MGVGCPVGVVRQGDDVDGQRSVGAWVIRFRACAATRAWLRCCACGCGVAATAHDCMCTCWWWCQAHQASRCAREAKEACRAAVVAVAGSGSDGSRASPALPAVDSAAEAVADAEDAVAKSTTSTQQLAVEVAARKGTSRMCVLVGRAVLCMWHPTRHPLTCIDLYYCGVLQRPRLRQRNHASRDLNQWRRRWQKRKRTPTLSA